MDVGRTLECSQLLAASFIIIWSSSWKVEQIKKWIKRNKDKCADDEDRRNWKLGKDVIQYCSEVIYYNK